MVAVELRLCGREGAAEVFQPVAGDLLQLNLLAMVQARGLQAVLDDIHVRAHEMSDAMVISPSVLASSALDFDEQKMTSPCLPLVGTALDFDDARMIVRAGSFIRQQIHIYIYIYIY